jgi:predicted ATPase/tRNA A-37 threonylcarbamoyl transferase component Bud32
VSALETNRTLGHFRIEAAIGQGGMGEVYRATDLKLGRTVALKVLPPEATRDPEARARFLQEARFASVLNHPNIVTIFAVDEADGIDFIVMELAEGESLRARAQRGPLDVPELIEVGIQCAEALGAAHALGLIHRDVKSANVVLTSVTPQGKSRAKILDFGLAKRMPNETARGLDATVEVDLTSAGMVMGSPGYMSPEQARGASLDARTDIFSLGCTLYEAAVGRVPFEGPSTMAVMHATWTQEPTPPTRLRPELPIEIDAILARCMAKEREERYGSARELADALAGLREGSDTQSGTVSAARLAIPRGPNNLPAALTSFIGRKREAAEIRRLLGQARLVTLAGPGGCGKTRLAIQVAKDLLVDTPGGTWLVDLAPLRDPTLVAQYIAAAAGVREESGRPIVETLTEAFGAKAMMLVLDNCEHLIGGCAPVARALLEGCPHLRVLATTQEPLGVPGEIVWRIPMLGIPDLGSAGSRTREAIGRYEAVRLFADRAAGVQPGFQLTEQNAVAIAQICRRLDGIPLAIELAAARARVLAPDQILARLEDRFRLLTGGSRTALPKQQTLRAAVDWSYELLAPVEKTLLNRLSVFAGGFTLEAVEAVCAGDSLDVLDVLDQLSHLVDRSLVAPEETEERQVRYRILETIREYGREKLAAAGERGQLQERHAAFYLALAEQAEPELTGPSQGAWLNRLEREHENLRVAIAYFGEVAPDIPRGLRLVGALWRFWWVRGNWAEGRARLSALLDVAGEEPERGKALHAAAVLARGEGDYATARRMLEEALRHARARDDRSGVAHMLFELGNVANDQEDYAAARPLYEESLALRRGIADQRGVSAALHNLGVVAAALGDFASAEQLYGEALSLHRELGNRAWEAASLNGLGGLAFYLGDLETSGQRHEEALPVQRELGDSRGTAFSLRELGEVATGLGDYPAARSHLAKALAIYKELGDRQGMASTMEGASVLAAAMGRPERALRLFGAACTLRTTIQAPISLPDEKRMRHFLDRARSALGEGAKSATDAGRLLSLEEAVGLALDDG